MPLLLFYPHPEAPLIKRLLAGAVQDLGQGRDVAHARIQSLPRDGMDAVSSIANKGKAVVAEGVGDHRDLVGDVVEDHHHLGDHQRQIREAERVGVRPLAVAGDPGGRDWVQLSRKHQIEVDRERGFVSVFGGKLTDCLKIK